MSACGYPCQSSPCPLIIDVSRVSCANSWTYFLLAINVIVWIFFALMIQPFAKIVPKTGAILHEFVTTVLND